MAIILLKNSTTSEDDYFCDDDDDNSDYDEDAIVDVDEDTERVCSWVQEGDKGWRMDSRAATEVWSIILKMDYHQHHDRRKRAVILLMIMISKGAGTFHSANQSKEGSVGFGTSQHPIFMKLLPDHLWH